jgi:uncharacterized ferritin-like protein (DUF455 family)
MNETLSRPLNLARTSVGELGRLYRLMFHFSFGVGRALAGYCPLIEPLPSKWALVEMVYTLLQHSSIYHSRLLELKVSERTIGMPTDETVDIIRRITEQKSWRGALGWFAKSALPRMEGLISEAIASCDSELLYHDKRNFTMVLSDIQRLAGMSAVRALPVDASIPVPLFEYAPAIGVPDTQTGAVALNVQNCPRRVYPIESRFVSERVFAGFEFESPEGVAAFLHDNLQIEFIALDIPMRNISDFPGMPFTFYCDMARHAHDEMRHATLLLHHLSILGFRLGDFAFETPDRYEVMIGEGLLYRMVVLSRTGEADAIEMIGSLAPALVNKGYDTIGAMFDHVLADEIRHTSYANRWIRYLVGDNDARVAQETAECIERYNLLIQGAGLPKKARKVNYLKSERPFGVDRLGRELAGFTASEIEIMGERAKQQ